jgi:hypothetical protein
MKFGLHSVYFSSDIYRVIKLRRLKCAGLITCQRKTNRLKILVGKHFGQRSLRRPRHTGRVKLKIGLVKNRLL